LNRERNPFILPAMRSLNATPKLGLLVTFSLVGTLAFAGCDKLDALRGGGKSAPSASSKPGPVASTLATTVSPKTAESAPEHVGGIALAPKWGTFATNTLTGVPYNKDLPDVDIKRGGFTTSGGFGVCGTTHFVETGAKVRPARSTCAFAPRKLGGALVKEADLPITVADAVSVTGPNTWKYGARISLRVRRNDAGATADFGGTLDGADAVFPVKLTRPLAANVVYAAAAAGPSSTLDLRIKRRLPGLPSAAPTATGTAKAPAVKEEVTAVPSVFYLSADGRTLGGYVAYQVKDIAVARIEAGSTFQAFAWDVDLFAAGIIQEYGYKQYALKKYDEAATRFSEAAVTAPTWELPRYNEACAWSLGKSPEKAKAALVDAIARGGDVVRQRAKKDKDFASYATEAWFVSTVN
jgi:hypothetical protein